MIFIYLFCFVFSDWKKLGVKHTTGLLAFVLEVVPKEMSDKCQMNFLSDKASLVLFNLAGGVDILKFMVSFATQNKEMV